MDKNRCDVDLIHQEDVTFCKEEIEKIALDLVLKKFKLIADEKRFKILYSLFLEEELCVCDIANILDSSIATASHHLQQLKKIGAVNYRQKGKMLYYSIKNQELIQLIQLGIKLQEEA